jgi:hypothetical protein
MPLFRGHACFIICTTTTPKKMQMDDNIFTGFYPIVTTYASPSVTVTLVM